MISEQDQMIEVTVSPGVLVEAHRKSVEMGALRNSITGGGGNLAGFIGEGLTAEYLSTVGPIDYTNTYQYDMIFNRDVAVDVKTKQTSVKPLLTYDCSISAKQLKQDCEVYVFCRVLKDFSRGWIMGWRQKDSYFDEANFMEKGVIDPSNGWKVSMDCYNLPIAELEPMNEIHKYVSAGHRD